MDRITELSALHFSNALVSISVTLSGMVTEVSEVQLAKAIVPILETLSGISTDSNFEQR